MDRNTKIISVVCGVIYKDEKILIARRKPDKSLGGHWEFPGGKIEKGEKLEESLKRELLEELGMQANVVNYLTVNEHDYGAFRIKLFAFKCSFTTATMQLIDHDGYQWVLPEELLTFRLTPADIPIAKLIA